MAGLFLYGVRSYGSTYWWIVIVITLCVCLAGIALLFAKLWSDSKAEILGLRNQIASLKRQLKSGRR